MQPKTLGHVIIMYCIDEKAHKYKSISDLERSDYDNYCDIVYRVSKVLRNAVERISGARVEKIYVATFSEDKDWHAHTHVISRATNLPDEIGPKIFKLQTPYIPKHDIEQLVFELKKEFKLIPSEST